jgi:Resolvase, N terminal domain
MSDLAVGTATSDCGSRNATLSLPTPSHMALTISYSPRGRSRNSAPGPGCRGAIDGPSSQAKNGRLVSVLPRRWALISTEAQEARETIGSQLDVLKERIADEGHDLVSEFCDDGCSGARRDRPGLDAPRDAAEAGLFEAVWCLSPDRLARAYVNQMLVLDELARFGVRVMFSDAPAFDDDPQGRLLTQIQGVYRRVRKGQDGRALPPRQAVAVPLRRGGLLEGPVRL